MNSSMHTEFFTQVRRVFFSLLLILTLAACRTPITVPPSSTPTVANTATLAPSETPVPTASPTQEPSPTPPSSATPEATATPSATQPLLPTLPPFSTPQATLPPSGGSGSAKIPTPYAPKYYSLTITNNSGQLAILKLESLSQPGSGYIFRISPGEKITAWVAADNYRRTTQACGLTQTIVAVLSNNTRLVIPACK